MRIFSYSAVDGVLRGEGVADADPLDKGNWLVPAFATPTEPPAFDVTTERARWDGASWVVEPIPAPPAAPTPTLAEAKTAKNAEINFARALANQAGFDFGGKRLASDPLSRSDIDGVASYVALFDALPPGFPGAWKAIDNSLVPVADVATFKALVAAMVAQGAANFARAQERKTALAAATTLDQVGAIAW